ACRFILSVCGQSSWEYGTRAPAFFGKAEMGPIRFQREKFAGSLCLRRPRFVRVTSFRPNRGSKHRLSHDL
ncbi:hypothetical protein, partial [Methylomonas albis]